MGRTLQKTSVFPNIKERLDSSCTMFSPDGGLVSDAACVPVHLGSTQFCVKHMHKRKGKLEEGNVLVSNHPSARYYCRAAILGEKLVEKGRFNKERIVELLLHGPAKYPGVSGTRTSSDNLSDLKAQHVFAIQQNAEQAVCALLKKKHTSGAALRAVEYMDDGTPIDLPISIDGETGSAVFNFTSTDSQVYANIRVPDLFFILSLAPGASVVSGNILMSQRINYKDEEVLGEGLGHYKTIDDGVGAGPSWEGSRGVYMYMTNTHITDPEVFEKRYPGYSWHGRHRGSNRIGLILSEKITRAPKGLNSSGNGGIGINL
ncbi:ykl215c-like protein [Ustulina deusta]|nr:ykl215c-like protein [Ustulina deusta]